MRPIIVVGAGFAGVETTWTLARHGLPVTLYEMRPEDTTPAHTTGHFAELVCSNSFKSKLASSPAGQLKAEMEGLGSIVLATAKEHEVPAGQALGVDRDAFAAAITRKVESMTQVEVRRQRFTPEMADAALDKGDRVVLATGPLTSPNLSAWLARQADRRHLYFYDAVSPTVDASTIDREVAFAQSRYDKGEGDDYLNCPFDRDTYEAFVRELVCAERAPIHAFEAGGRRDASGEVDESGFLEKVRYFAGCTPIEAIAEKGVRSLAFGNFKPVGLTDPRTGRRPYAALQLRPENREGTLYSLVACQTRLKWGEQKRVFQMVPGLEGAEFVRYGVIHRNTYVEAPKLLDDRLRVLSRPNLYLTGQLVGVEGYVESAAMGLLTGWAIALESKGQDWPAPPRECAFGCLMSHLQDQTEREFAPMNINWGLFPDPDEPIRDKGRRREAKLVAAVNGFAAWQSRLMSTRPER